MRGIGRTLSRLNATPARSMRAMIAGAAMLAGTAVPAIQAEARNSNGPPNGGGDETAMAVPRVGLHGGAGGAALPQPLSAADASRVRRIFALQGRGDIPAAIRETDALGDNLLVGSILADRYLGRFHRTTPAELADWLRDYAGQPDSRAIHAVLARREPNAEAASFPETLEPATAPDALPEDLDPRDHAIQRSPGIDRALAEHLRTGNAAAALHMVAATRGLAPAYGALLRGEAARALFADNRDEDALRVAGAAARQAPGIALPAYVAGLAAWRLDRLELAVGYFEAAAHADVAPAAVRAAAAFWAARARLRMGDTGASVPLLRLAADQPRTFYGLLARRTLGLNAGLGWNQDTLGLADVEAIAAFPAGKRAFALLQVGQSARADAELRTIWPTARTQAGLGHALLLVASQAGLLDLAAQLATLVQESDGRARDFARFPVPRLSPRGGFRVDPALVYALARLESNFDNAAISQSGAHGLMQLMPITASYIAHDPAFGEGGAMSLHDPAVNLDLGQRYIRYLAEQDGIQGNLIYLLASYNGGPNAVRKWAATARHMDDPLLFVEAIPNQETRIFVQHALAFTWIYAARLRLPAPSLDELAAGGFPRYAAVTGAAMPAPRIH